MDQAISTSPAAPVRGWRFALLCAAVLLAAGFALRFAAFLASGGTADPLAFADAMCRLDCLWYEQIATEGYGGGANTAGRASWAFFPLAPLWFGIVQQLSGLPFAAAAMLGATVAAFWAAVAAWPLFGGNRFAFLAAAGMMLLGPPAVWFTTGYSESLFVLFGIVALVQLRRRHWIVAGLAIALLGATRLVGVLMVLPMLLARLEAHRQSGRDWPSLPQDILRDGPFLLGVALAPLGLSLFMATLQLVLGDGLAFLRVQYAWGRSIDWPWVMLFETMTGATTPLGLLLALFAVIGLLLALWLVLRGLRVEALFLALGIIVPLSGGVLSMPRFLAGLAPFHLAMGLLLGRLWPVALASLPIWAALGYAATLGWLDSLGIMV